MALNFTDVNLTGDYAAPYLVKALTGFETAQTGNIFIKDKSKKVENMKRITVDSLIQDYAAEPVSAGNINTTKRQMTMENWNLYFEFNPREYESVLDGDYNYDLLDPSLPQNETSVFISEVLKFHDNYVETATWQSVSAGTAPYDKIDGIIQRLITDSDGDVIQVGTHAVLTSANILAKMLATRDKIPAALELNPKTKFYVSRATWKLYSDAQKAQPNKGVDITKRGELFYDGYEVFPLVGVPNDTIIVAQGSADRGSNFQMNINTKADFAEVKVMPKNNYSDLWFLKMSLAAAVNYGWGSEIVFYHSSNA